LDAVERWSGQLLLLGGTLIVIASIIHPQGGTSQFLQQPLWVPAHLLEYVAFMSVLLGLVGWYSRFSTNLGKLGTLGFLISFFGTATGGGLSLVSEALLRPYFAANSPMLQDALGSNGGFIAAFLITILAVFIGYLMFSVAVVRARVLPSWGIWLVVILVIGIGSLFGAGVAYFTGLIGEGLLGLSIAGWGYAIMSTPRRVESSDRLQAR
jgi:hypothetical protein